MPIIDEVTTRFVESPADMPLLIPGGARPEGPQRIVSGVGVGLAIRYLRLVRATGAAFACILALVSAPVFAHADACGDDLDGRRVACRCGDTVVSDTRLAGSDPVVTTRCTLDGLTIRARDLAESIRVDLNGQVLRGSGVGNGVLVVYGGTDGAQLVGAAAPAYGTIADFGIGLAANRGESLARVEQIELRDNREEGVRVKLAGTVFENVIAHGNARDGFHLLGKGGRLAGVRSYENGENGIRLFATDVVVGASADHNARSGIIVDGEDNDLDAAEASANGRDGIVIRGSGGAMEVLRAESNARDDIRLNGKPPPLAEESR